MPLGSISSLIASRELSCLISKSFWVLLDCLIHKLSFWNLFFNNSGSSCIGPFQPFCISIVKHGFNPELRVSYLAGQTASSFLPAQFLYVFCLLSSLSLLCECVFFCHRFTLFLLFPRIREHSYQELLGSELFPSPDVCWTVLAHCTSFNFLSDSLPFLVTRSPPCRCPF